MFFKRRGRREPQRAITELRRYVEDWVRRRHLQALGIEPKRVKLASRSRKGYWRMSGNSIVQRALTNRWLQEQGGPDMKQQRIALHYPEQQGV